MNGKVLVVEAGTGAATSGDAKRWLLCERFATGAVALREWYGAQSAIADQARSARAEVWAIEAGARSTAGRAAWETLAQRLGGALEEAGDDAGLARTRIEEALEESARDGAARAGAAWQRFDAKGEKAQPAGRPRKQGGIEVQCLLGARGEIWIRCADEWTTQAPGAGALLAGAWVLRVNTQGGGARERLKEALEAVREQALQADPGEDTGEAVARVERTLKEWETALGGAQQDGWKRMQMGAPKPDQGKAGSLVGRIVGAAIIAGMLWQGMYGGEEARSTRDRAMKREPPWSETPRTGNEMARSTRVGAMETEPAQGRWSCATAAEEIFARARAQIVTEGPSEAPAHVRDAMENSTDVLVLELEEYAITAEIDPGSGWIRVEAPGGSAWYTVDTGGCRSARARGEGGRRSERCGDAGGAAP